VVVRAVCERQTGDRAAAVRNFRDAKRFSCVYEIGDSMEFALIWSSGQLAMLAEIARGQ
jgi:hypothetical protein